MATPADTSTPAAAPDNTRKRKAWLLGLLLLLILAGAATWAWYSLNFGSRDTFLVHICWNTATVISH